MKSLILAIQERLKTDTTLNYVRDIDIIVTEDEGLLPNYVKFPSISIKDGAAKNQQLLCGNYMQSAQVQITAYQKILKIGESVVGTHGVLDIVSDIITSLVGNTLSESGNRNAFPISEDASQFFGDEEELIQRKTITMQYEIHKTWS